MISRTLISYSRMIFILWIFCLLEKSSASNSSLDFSNFTTTVTHSNGSSHPTTTTPSNAPTVAESTGSSLDNGLQGLYRMTCKFLDVVQPPGKNLYDELEVEKAMNLTSNDPLKAWQTSFKSREPRFFLNYFAGFAVCLAFGAVFVLVMPIVGVFLCLCRYCCHSCGHEDTGTLEGPRDRPMRICLGSSLLVLTIVILAGTICSFMSNELVRRQTTSSDDDEVRRSRDDDVVDRSVLDVTIDNFARFESFKQTTVQELKSLLEQTNYTVYNTLDVNLNDFPSKATSKIKRFLGADQLLSSVLTLNTTFVRVVGSLSEVDKSFVILTGKYRSLNDSLTQFESDYRGLCNAVPSSSSSHPCQLPSLNVDSTNDDLNISEFLNLMSKDNSIDTSVLDAFNISNRILKEMQPAFDAVQKADISGKVSDLQLKIDSYALQIPSLESTMRSINETKQNIEKYGDYRFYVCVAICSFLLLIVVLNLVGLCIGAFTKPPYDHQTTGGPCLTRWTAGYCLLASAILMFMFGFVLMVIVALLFVSGGVVYTEGCRGFETGDRSNALVKTADAFLRSELGNVSFQAILRDCGNNLGIVGALNLDQRFNISGQLDFQNLKSLDFEGKFNIGPIDLSALTKSKSKLSELERLSHALPTLIADSRNQLKNSEIQMRSSLSSAIRSLNETAENTTESRVKQELTNATQRLQFLSDTLGDEITEATNRLQNSLVKLNESLYIDNSSKFVAEYLQDLSELIDLTENRTTYELPELIQQLIRNLSSSLKSSINASITQARTQMMSSVGRCGPISKVISNIYSSVCHSTVNPYNAFWFSYGWCVFFFIPTIAIVVSLATLYLRSDDVTISCYDPYKSSDDYFRLQNLATPEHSVGNGRHGNELDSDGSRNYYGSNPGYVDDGNDSASRRQGNASSPPANFYGGNGFHGNHSYPDNTESTNFHIQRPMVQTQDGSYDNNSYHHRF